MQEEVDQKTIALAVKTGKLTAQVLQAAIRKYLAARQKGTGKAHHGQQSLTEDEPFDLYDIELSEEDFAAE